MDSSTHAALVSILADLAADALGFGLVVAGVWALAKGHGALREWRRDRQAADRRAPMLVDFEHRQRNAAVWRRFPAWSKSAEGQRVRVKAQAAMLNFVFARSSRYPRLSAELRKAIIHEATHE